jgi:thiol-disulfide isomerase/thioredoxin
VRDYAQVRGSGVIDRPTANAALTMLEVDAHGFDEIDRRLLLTIIQKYDGGPVGLGTLAATLAEEEDALEEVYEPFLIQIGFLDRTPRGRVATRLAYEHFGLRHAGPADAAVLAEQARTEFPSYWIAKELIPWHLLNPPCSNSAPSPRLCLTDVVTGNDREPRRFSAAKKALLVMFICAHCPYVKHIEEGSGQLGRDYAGKPLGIVAISSNDVTTHPADSPAGLKQQAETFGFVFPYLYDETQPWPMPTRPPAHRTSFSSTAISALSIAASSMRAAPATAFP